MPTLQIHARRCRLLPIILLGLSLLACSSRQEANPADDNPGNTPFLSAEHFGAGRQMIRQDDEYHAMARIPAGEFLMGEHGEKVALEAFRIDRYEVLLDDYLQCVAAGVCQPARVGWSGPRMPVGGVDWHQASVYCHWLGKRLPTSAEWEKAARGSAGGHRFPWGDQWEPTYANWCDSEQYQPQGDKPPEAYPCEGTIDGYATAAPIDAFPENVSPYGVRQMCGNQLEWTATPLKTEHGEGYAVRGGAWWGPRGMGIPMISLTTWVELWDPPYGAPQHVGIRCAE